MCFVHRLPTIEDADDVKYDLRSIFPVIDFHVPLIIAVFAVRSRFPSRRSRAIRGTLKLWTWVPWTL